MNTNKGIKRLGGAALLGLVAATLASSASAATLLPCKTSDVQVTGIAQYSSTGPDAVLGSVVPVSSPAAACVGAYSGNDQEYPATNLGYYGDGLMNGGTTGPSEGSIQLFPNGVFSSLYTPTDLNGDNILDPGWIMLGKHEGGQFAPEDIGSLMNIVLSSFFSLTVDADGHSGTWAFTPDAEVAKRAVSILGKNYFDQFMLVFKSGGAWAAYDFTAEQFGLTEPSADDPIYNFYGTWDTSETLQNCNKKDSCQPAGISHVTLYARDPGATNDVPEPASLALIGLGLVGLSAIRRRRYR